MKKIILLFTMLFAVSILANAYEKKEFEDLLINDGYVENDGGYKKQIDSTIINYKIRCEDNEVVQIVQSIYFNPNEEGNISIADESPLKYYPEFLKRFGIYPIPTILRGGEGNYCGVTINYVSKEILSPLGF